MFLSKINPNKKAKLINNIERRKFIFFSKKVLFDEIKKGGSSIRDFKNISGIKGEFQKKFNVYQREGLKCKRTKCKGTILKKNISKRSTFFCNSCQK